MWTTGVDPIENHAAPPAKLRYRRLLPKRPDALPTPSASILTTTVQSAVEATHTSASRKRSADPSSSADPRRAKKTNTVSRQTLNESTGLRTEEEDGSRPPPPPEPDLQQQVEPALQVCRYLLEMFSVPLLRSHATVSLIDRDRLQLYHANRSVILVSSAIDFSKGDGKEKFIATIIAFHCLSLEQNGILSRVPENLSLLSGTKLAGDRVVQRGNKLMFFGARGCDPFEVTLGETISRDPAMVGRSTLVLKATSDRWKGPLAVKISWPTSGRISETAFLTKANGMATGKHEWAANHLPRVHYAEDVVFDSNSTLESVACLLKNAEFENGSYVYERRTLRIIIQEQLHPLKSLTNVKDIGQVFLDVACGTRIGSTSRPRPAYPTSVHHWLHKYPGILHRDISLNNIMYRVTKEKGGIMERRVYGVLTDYDLSSWTETLNDGYTKTSQQRTGTPPFMAHELLKGTSSLHLYRHDVESLFYVMLLVSARHTIPDGVEEPRVVMRRSRGIPYQDWFHEQRYYTLGSLKGAFWGDMKPLVLSPVFEDFRPWLADLRYRFSTGFKLKPTPVDPTLPEWLTVPTGVEFDDETLGGHINYATVMAPVQHLTGELKGLVIRDPEVRPPAPASSAPASPAKTDNLG